MNHEQEPEHGPKGEPEEKRTFCYLVNGGYQIVPPEIKKVSDWPWRDRRGLLKRFPTALAWISERDGKLLVHNISDSPPEIINNLLLIHFGVNPKFINPAVWNELPIEVIREIKAILEARCLDIRRVVTRSSEAALSGHVFVGMNQPLTVKDWKVDFRAVEFSNVAKEPLTGTDVAVTLMMTGVDGTQAIKTIWFQAKKAEATDVDLTNIPDLHDQLATMRLYTPDSFALLYTKDGVVVGEHVKQAQRRTLPDFIADSLRCHHGDPSPELFIDSVDRKMLLNIKIVPKNKLQGDS